MGEAAAAGLLALRADHGYGTARFVRLLRRAAPIGEFEPDGGCGAQPVDVKMAGFRAVHVLRPRPVRPGCAARLQLDGPGGGLRRGQEVAEQTDVVHFWAEYTYIHWNRNLAKLAADRDLSRRRHRAPVRDWFFGTREARGP